MLRQRAPATAEAEKAAPVSRQAKKQIQKLEEKKAKKAPAVADEPVAPEVRRKRMLKIGGAIICFLLIAYAVEVRRLNRLNNVEVDVRPGSEFHRNVQEYKKRAAENMRPIREVEKNISAEGGLGFELRWLGIPEEIRLQSLITAMNEFVTAPFISNLLLEGADPRIPRPGPVAQELLPELFALDVRTMATTDHILQLFRTLLLGYENGIPYDVREAQAEKIRNATEAALKNETATPEEVEEAKRVAELLAEEDALVEERKRNTTERAANMSAGEREAAELLVESRFALRSFFLSDFLRLVIQHAPLEKVQRAPPEVEKKFYEEQEAEARKAALEGSVAEEGAAAAAAEPAAAGEAAAAA